MARSFSPSNGANRPLHQDRQVLRADDLALEQATQDAMLARARRYLHGWGVVSGFVPEVTGSTNLTVGPGYGVTPLGDELFLPEPVSLPDVVDAAVACCGPGPLGCDVVDPEALAAARAAAADVTVTAWLIARPASREASPRAGVPEGCAHPASTLLAVAPLRRGGIRHPLHPAAEPPAAGTRLRGTDALRLRPARHRDPAVALGDPARAGSQFPRHRQPDDRRRRAHRRSSACGARSGRSR